MFDETINNELKNSTPTKRFGSSLSFNSTKATKDFERFFYRTSIKSVRATLLLVIFLYFILYKVVLSMSYPVEQLLFQPVFLQVSALLIVLFASTFSALYLKHPKAGNTIIATSCITSISIAMFTVTSLSPTLLYVTSLTMIASSIAFGLQWGRSVIVSISYFVLNLYLTSQSSFPFVDYTLPIFNLFGFLLIGILTGYMVSLLQINSFILKSNSGLLIEQLKINELKYKELSITDGLTHLFNRRHFDNIGNIKTSEAKRANSPMHLLILDLDHFKEFNDQYGHPEGDAALLSISLLLKKTFRRPSDSIFRIGGEEFAVITTGNIASNLSLYTETLHQNIAKENIPHITSAVSEKLTISVGIASLNTLNGETFKDLYHRADKALYHAKNSGKNQTAIY